MIIMYILHYIYNFYVLKWYTMAKERVEKEVLTRNPSQLCKCKVVMGSDVFVSGVRL